MTDRELIQAYADARDVASLGAFFGRYQASLLRFAGKLLGDGDQAQDVVQETFLQVARDPARLLEVESCHNWLLRVARNIGITHIRRDARARRRAGESASRTAAAAEESSRASATEVERSEVRVRVREAVNALIPRHRELVLLKVEENKSYREIAQITGLTVTNVGYLLHMAMKELSRRLKSSKEDLV